MRVCGVLDSYPLGSVQRVRRSLSCRLRRAVYSDALCAMNEPRGFGTSLVEIVSISRVQSQFDNDLSSSSYTFTSPIREAPQSRHAWVGAGKTRSERRSVLVSRSLGTTGTCLDQPGLSVSVRTYSSIFTGRCPDEFANTYVACQRTSYTQLAAYNKSCRSAAQCTSCSLLPSPATYATPASPAGCRLTRLSRRLSARTHARGSETR
jgi:hypothetical protein